MESSPRSSDAPRQTLLRVATGLRLNVVEWGDPAGLPFLLLHGGAHESGHWAEVCRLLPPSIRCIVPDARGHGKSDWSETGDYSCQSQVADWIGLLDELGVEGFVVAGHSMGGLSALMLAGQHPGRALGLIMMDVGTENRGEALNHIERRHGSAETSSSRDGGAGDAETSRGESLPSDRNEAAAAPGFDMRLLDHVPTYCGDAVARRGLLRAAAAPLLVLRGERSRIISRESAMTTAALVGGELVEIPEAGHNLAARSPEAVARALRDFLLPMEQQRRS